MSFRTPNCHTMQRRHFLTGGAAAMAALNNFPHAAYAATPLGPMKIEPNNPSYGKGSIPLSAAQRTAVLEIAEQLHAITQAARNGMPFPNSNEPGRSIEHVVTELTFLSTLLFAKVASINSKIAGKTFGELRAAYLSGTGTAEDVMRGFGLDPDKTFSYRDSPTTPSKDMKSAINFEVLNRPKTKRMAKALWAEDFMTNAMDGRLYGGPSCPVVQDLLSQMARVIDNFPDAASASTPLGPMNIELSNPNCRERFMPLSAAQRTAVLEIAEQLHTITQAARNGMSFPNSSEPGRSIEHVVTELTFLSTLLFAKLPSNNSKIAGKSFGELRTAYLSDTGTAEDVMRGFGLDPDKTFPYKDSPATPPKHMKSAINFEVLNRPETKRMAKALWAEDFMTNASGGRLYTGGSCPVVQDLLSQMARVIDQP